MDEQESRLRKELQLIKDRWLKSREEDISYFKEAFYDQYNLITLGGLGALTAVALVGGFVFAPVIGSLALAWEVCWLGIAPSSERFRRSVRARKNAAALEARDDKRKTLIDKVPAELRTQYEATAAIVKEIRKQAEAAQEGELEVFEETIAKLDYLLEEYARMLVGLDQLEKTQSSPEAGSLQRRVALLTSEVEATPPGRLRDAKEKNLLVLRQRAERIAKSNEEREYLEVSLETVENTLKLVRDQVIAATTAQGIASSLDQVVLEVGRHREHMQAVESELEAARQPFSLDVPPAEVSEPPPAPDATAKDDERERWRKALEG